MDWRPKNWENPYREFGMNIEERVTFRVLTEKEAIEVDKHEVYEEGANAMIEALFKMAEESPTKTFIIDSRIINIYGDKNED